MLEKLTFPLLLACLLALTLGGCSRRPAYREIHASNHYCHHRTGTGVMTHSHYHGR